jgi:hypothetical protein
VRVPYAAAHPAEAKAAASLALGAAAAASARNRDTLIVSRSTRGIKALVPTVYASAADRDFSHLYSTAPTTYSKDWLNEMAYCLEAKQRTADRRARDDAREAALLKARRAKFLTGGRKKGADGGGEVDKAAALAAFFDRQEQVEKRRVAGRDEAREMHDYNSRAPEDKKVCLKCGGVQSYAEFKGKVMRCPKESCGGAPYRPKLLWAEVQHSFLGRWKDGIKKMAENLAKTEREVRPPFRVTHRKTLNKETGEMEEVEIPKLSWEAVGDDFLTRQDEVVQKLNARIAANAAAKSAPIVFVKEKGPKSKFKLSKPLPDFHSRQAAMMEKKNMTFEDRLAAMRGE